MKAIILKSKLAKVPSRTLHELTKGLESSRSRTRVRMTPGCDQPSKQVEEVENRSSESMPH